MQIAMVRSRAILKIPGGEWSIRFACTREGNIILAYGRLWAAEMNEQKGHQESNRVCVRIHVCGGPLSAPINIYGYCEKNEQSEK